jgi:hypothetical protein
VLHQLGVRLGVFGEVAEHLRLAFAGPQVPDQFRQYVFRRGFLVAALQAVDVGVVTITCTVTGAGTSPST